MSSGSTPLPQKQAEWLTKTVGGDGASGTLAEKEQLDAKEDRRQARLDKIRGDLDGAKGEIQQQMNILVVVKGKTFLGMQSNREVSSMGEGGPDSLLDPTLDVPNIESIPEEARIRAQQAGEKVIKMSLRAQGYIHKSDWKAVVEATNTKSIAEVAAEWGVSERTITMVVDRYNETQKPGYVETGPNERLIDESVGDPDEVLDDQELRQEFWTPLVREGVYPENFVTDRYDETTQIFRGAAEQYDARIEELNETYNEAEARKLSMAAKTEFVQQCTETAKALAEAAGLDDSSGDYIEIASALANAGVALYENWDLKDAEQAIPAIARAIEKLVAARFDKATGKAIGACFQTIAKGGAFGQHLLSEEPDGTDKAFASLGDAALAAFGASETTAKFGAVLKTAFYSKGKAGAALKEVQKLHQGQATIADVLKAVKGAGHAACDAAKKDLISEEQAEATKLALDLTESAGKNLASRKLLDASKDIVNLFASVVAPEMVPGVGECFTLLRTSLKVDQFAKLVREGNMDEADKLVDEAIKAIDGKVKDWKKDQEKLQQEQKDKEEQDKPKTQPEGSGEQPSGEGDKPKAEGGDDDEEEGGDEEGGEPVDQSAFGLIAQIKNRVTGLDDVKQAIDDKTQQVDAQQQEDEDNEFSAQLALTFGESDGDPEMLDIQKEVQSIDRLIKQVQKDQALLKMADKIFDAGVKTAAQFYAGLESAGVAKNLIKDMVGAGRRYQELTRWVELHQVALQAASSQGFALASQVQNLKIDVGEKTLAALCELGQLSGTAVGALAGMAAGPGGVVAGVAVGAKAGSAGAKAVQGIADLCMKLYSASQLRSQWKLYGEAKKPPTDRRKMRAALRGNSTLAKYAMAYAAVEENDPIATEGMRLCGLTEVTLKHPATDVSKVVRFLELKFEQDPQVLQASTAQAWQEDKTNALTLASWVKNLTAARDKKLLDEAVQTAAIEDGLTGVGVAQDELDEVDDDCAATQQKYETEWAKYDPLLDIYTTQSQRSLALEAFLNTRASESDKLKNEISSATNVTAAKRKDYEKQLNKLDRDLTDSQATLAAGKSAAAAYQQAIQPFADAIDPYAAAIINYAAAFAKCESALSTLSGALKAFRPKKKQGQSTVESPDVQAYAQALLKSVSVAETTLKTKKGAIDGLLTSLPAAKSAAREHESKLATTTGKMDELLRKSDTLKLEATATRNKLGLLPTV